MKKTYLFYVLAIVLCASLAGCQKVTLVDEEDTPTTENGVSVKFNVAQLEQIPFDDLPTGRSTDVKAVCSRINLAVYRNGEKINQINQTNSDAEFGKLKLTLPVGHYRVVVLAHSGLKNPTMTDEEKITFDGKVTDTFYWTEEIDVDDNATFNVAMKRAVAMFRLVITDDIPANVALMRFYYTGGSSTFDAVHGVGCVKSKQTELIDVTSAMRKRPSTFEVYTFPRTDTNLLKIKVSAHDGENNNLVERDFENVKIARNLITRYTGPFFGGETGGEQTTKGEIFFNLSSDDEWDETGFTF